MKHFLVIFFLTLFFNTLSAQEKHFVFIQSENKLPFYVSVNGKLYSSTASGYLIVPKLAGGNYNFTVGFAQNAFPEQVFTTTIQDKDLGYELKNLGEKGWALFNLQSLELAMATTATGNVVAKALSETSNVKTQEAVISFDKKKNPAAEQKKISSDTATGDLANAPKQEVGADSTKAGDKDPVTEAAADEAVARNRAPGKKETGDVKKVSEVTNQDGVRLSYVDGSGKQSDTIQVIIPSSSPDANSPTNPNTTTNTNNPKGVSASPAVENNTGSTNSGKDDVRFLDINMSGKKDSAATAPPSGENVKVMENSNCKNIATEDDYTKLRKKMAGETTDEKMINEAKKVYRNKCFTTSQIKGLSTLFLSDEGRFRFFDASFVSVADANQYYSLQSEFIDPAFVNRFKSLLQ